jgi:hypothetical protein
MDCPKTLYEGMTMYDKLERTGDEKVVTYFWAISWHLSRVM